MNTQIKHGGISRLYLCLFFIIGLTSCQLLRGNTRSLKTTGIIEYWKLEAVLTDTDNNFDLPAGINKISLTHYNAGPGNILNPGSNDLVVVYRLETIEQVQILQEKLMETGKLVAFKVTKQ